MSDKTDKSAERKLRIHPKEAGHSIEPLPSLSLASSQGGELSAEEITKRLGIEIRGVGKGAEVWFVGVSAKNDEEPA